MVSKLSQKLITNTTYLTLDWVVATLFSLIYWIIVGKFLPPEQYGIVATVNGFAPFVAMLSMIGLNQAIMKLIPEYIVREKNKIKPMIRFSFKITLAINFLIALSIIIFSNQLSSILKINTTTLFLSYICILFISMFSMSGSILYGFQNMRKYFTSDFIGQIAKVVLAVSTMYIGFRFYGPILGLIAAFLVSFVLRFNIRWVLDGYKQFDKKVLFEYAAPGLIAILLSAVFSYYQYFILPIVQNQTIAGLFAVALRITTLITMIPSILISGLFPILSKLSAVKNSKRLQGILVGNVFRYTLFLVVPLATFAILFAKPLVIFFSQHQYLEAALLFPILSIASAVYGLGIIYSQTLYAVRKPRLFRNIAIASLLTFIGTSIPFAYFYSSTGLSISYLLSASMLFFLSFLFTYKNIPFSLDTINILKIIPATIAFSTILIISEIVNVPYAIKVVIVILSFPAYVFALAILKFYSKQDIKILRFLGRKISFIRRPANILADFLSK